MSHAGYLILAEHLAQQIATDYDKHGTEKQLAASIRGTKRKRDSSRAHWIANDETIAARMDNGHGTPQGRHE
jgi:hypothetical protein